MYWQDPGRENTEKTLKVAHERLVDSDLDHVVIASNSGETVEEYLDIAGENRANVVCVTHHVGYREPGLDEMGTETRRELANRGVEVLTTTHALAGVARSLKNEFGGLYPAEIMASALRMLGQGVKVAVEISVMALDAGLVPYGEELIAVGGTGRGADTACVVRPDHSNNVLNTKVLEVLCRPRE